MPNNDNERGAFFCETSTKARVCRASGVTTWGEYVSWAIHDGQFVKNLDETHRSGDSQSHEEIAHALGKQTIAEFVENKENLWMKVKAITSAGLTLPYRARLSSTTPVTPLPAATRSLFWNFPSRNKSQRDRQHDYIPVLCVKGQRNAAFISIPSFACIVVGTITGYDSMKRKNPREFTAIPSNGEITLNNNQDNQCIHCL